MAKSISSLAKTKNPRGLRFVAIGQCGALLLAGVLAVLSQANCSISHGFTTQKTSGGRNEITVQPDGDLQAALKAAQPGDTIILVAGAEYRGPFVLPNKGAGTGKDADFITIRTSEVSGISPEGERISPQAHQRSMARIVSPARQSAINTEEQAHHYKFIGIEFAPAADASYVYNVIDLGSSSYDSLSQFPHHLVFDRCYIHSTGLNKARRGLALNTAETTLVNSYVSGFAGDGDETQAVAGWAGPGPFHIINNFLEGGAEVLLFGGADPSVSNLVPSDIEIRNNYFHKPISWQGKATIKGTLELKNARRVLIEGNLLESEILVTALVVTVRNQDGRAPWSTIEDVEIKNNIVHHASTGVNILGKDTDHPSQEARRIKIVNNLFVDIVNPGDMAYFLQVNGTDSLSVDHNTVQQNGNIISSYGQPAKNFGFQNNIVQYNLYGIACFIQGPTCPDMPYCNCFPGAKMKGNIVADNANVSASNPLDKAFPPGNFLVRSYAELGFIEGGRATPGDTNTNYGNWQLGTRSQYSRKATDGKDPGIDYGELTTSGVLNAKSGVRRKP
ncbi:MAG TPA: hypothetical protein VGN86_12885 [Pyrinomonadaceae bacterium]|nr:hypothetical protein [Pyrinomonadaceae bacterium]